jgi:hypothetical protein
MSDNAPSVARTEPDIMTGAPEDGRPLCWALDHTGRWTQEPDPVAEWLDTTGEIAEPATKAGWERMGTLGCDRGALEIELYTEANNAQRFLLIITVLCDRWYTVLALNVPALLRILALLGPLLTEQRVEELLDHWREQTSAPAPKYRRN